MVLKHVIGVGLLVVCPAITGAQSPDAAVTSRTAWGHPDLQGLWTNKTTTPIERPTPLATERSGAADAPLPPASSNRPGLGTGGYNSFWLDQGSRIDQPSLIVDPPDGKLPAVTRQAQRKADEFTARWIAPPASWEDMNVYDRCLTRGLPGAMMPGFYNHNYLILQTPDAVVLQVEMIHDARIIPLNGRPHVQSSIRQWLGDSRGHWEGETLVVETTNFTDKAGQRAAIGRLFVTFSGSGHARLVERFTRIDADTIDYEFTVVDPTVDMRPWTASIPMSRTESPIYEYACHEGNHSVVNILAGARADERKDADGTLP